MCNTIKIAWLVANFLKDLGHMDVTEKILTALNKKLVKVKQIHVRKFTDVI
jgi:hypothetical protein